MEPERIVLFDGVCNVCNAGVDFLLRRDRAGRLRFASLQGETAARLRAAHPEIPAEVETMALVERGDAGERVYLRSEAVLRTLAALGGLWRVLLVLVAIPAPLRDLGYRAFAAVRYRLFGRRASCRVPTPEERGRVLP